MLALTASLPAVMDIVRRLGETSEADELKLAQPQALSAEHAACVSFCTQLTIAAA